MAVSSLKFSDGVAREGKTRYATGSGAVRRSDVVAANPGESLASITQRAYGANSAENRAKIVGANATLSGDIVVPR